MAMDWLTDPGTPEPGRVLTPYRITARFIKPYYLSVLFRTQDECLFAMHDAADDSLAACHISAGDILVFDRTKTAPRDGAIVLVRDGKRGVARVARHTAGGLVFCAEGHPTLTGARRVYGTLAGLVRAYEAEEVLQPHAPEQAGHWYGLGYLDGQRDQRTATADAHRAPEPA